MYLLIYEDEALKKFIKFKNEALKHKLVKNRKDWGHIEVTEVVSIRVTRLMNFVKSKV